MPFWNLSDHPKQHIIKGYNVDEPSHIIELANSSIALSSNDYTYPIVIINSLSYEIKEILLKENIYIYHCVCLMNILLFMFMKECLFRYQVMLIQVFLNQKKKGLMGIMELFLLMEGNILQLRIMIFF